jgi:hypothetical protein
LPNSKLICNNIIHNNIHVIDLIIKNEQSIYIQETDTISFNNMVELNKFSNNLQNIIDSFNYEDSINNFEIKNFKIYKINNLMNGNFIFLYSNKYDIKTKLTKYEAIDLLDFIKNLKN